MTPQQQRTAAATAARKRKSQGRRADALRAVGWTSLPPGTVKSMAVEEVRDTWGDTAGRRSVQVTIVAYLDTQEDFDTVLRGFQPPAEPGTD